MTILDAALDAAMEAVTRYKKSSAMHNDRETAKLALTAAAPFIAAQAWDEGRVSYRDDLSGTPSYGTPGYKETTNPYRSGT